MIKRYNTFQIKELDQKIKKISDQISQLPKGTLNISHQGNHYYYKLHHPDGTYRYIPKEELALARDLAFRHYLELQLEELIVCRKALDRYQKSMDRVSDKAARYLLENEGAARLLRESFPIGSAPLAAWASRPQNDHVPHPENRTFSCRSGHVVRSKSESMIDSALFTAQIPFRYEDPLILGQTTLYPDFTIRHPVSGAYIYWEHFGLMDVPRYIHASAEKLEIYARHGYTPFNNLIITCETDQHPLTDTQIDLMIFYFFQK